MNKNFEYKELKLLVVEDNLLTREELVEILRDIGFKTILEAEDGNQAIQVFIDQSKTLKPVDLIISDINMPRINGIDFLKMMKSVNPSYEVPIIMVTTEASMSTVLECIDAGASEYILKPFKKMTILEKLANCCKKIRDE